MKIKIEKLLANWYRESQSAFLFKPESVYFYSLHKAGTSLFTHVLRHANNLVHVDYETMLFDNKLFEEPRYYKYGHLYGVFRITGPNSSTIYTELTKYISTKEFVKDKIIVFMIRDPRDILISWYYSMRNTHISSPNPKIQKRFQIYRDSLQTMTLDDFVIREAPKVYARFEILYELSQNCKRTVILKYENLMNNFDDFMRDFSEYISISEERKQELFEASRPRVVEDLSAHKRSGKIGQYKEKLMPNTIYQINQMFNPIIKRFDYDITEIHDMDHNPI